MPGFIKLSCVIDLRIVLTLCGFIYIYHFSDGIIVFQVTTVVKTTFFVVWRYYGTTYVLLKRHVEEGNVIVLQCLGNLN